MKARCAQITDDAFRAPACVFCDEELSLSKVDAVLAEASTKDVVVLAKLNPEEGHKSNYKNFLEFCTKSSTAAVMRVPKSLGNDLDSIYILPADVNNPLPHFATAIQAFVPSEVQNAEGVNSVFLLMALVYTKKVDQ